MIGHQNQFEWTNSPQKNNQTHTQTETLLSKIYQISISCSHCHVFLHQFFLWSNRQGDWKTTFAKITSEDQQYSPMSNEQQKRGVFQHVQEMRSKPSPWFFGVYINTNFSWSMLGISNLSWMKCLPGVCLYLFLCISYLGKLANHITPIEFETRLKSFLETLALFKTRVERIFPSQRPCLLKFLFVPGLKKTVSHTQYIHFAFGCFWDKLEHLKNLQLSQCSPGAYDTIRETWDLKLTEGMPLNRGHLP